MVTDIYGNKIIVLNGQSSNGNNTAIAENRANAPSPEMISLLWLLPNINHRNDPILRQREARVIKLNLVNIASASMA